MIFDQATVVFDLFHYIIVGLASAACFAVLAWQKGGGTRVIALSAVKGFVVVTFCMLVFVVVLLGFGLV